MTPAGGGDNKSPQVARQAAAADDKGRQSNRKRPSYPHLRTQMVRRLDLDGVWC